LLQRLANDGFAEAHSFNRMSCRVLIEHRWAASDTLLNLNCPAEPIEFEG
jgi:hypothetical protein